MRAKDIGLQVPRLAGQVPRHMDPSRHARRHTAGELCAQHREGSPAGTLGRGVDTNRYVGQDDYTPSGAMRF